MDSRTLVVEVSVGGQHPGVDEAAYRKRFFDDPDFGLAEARALADGAGFAHLALTRVREGSSLVFALGDARFLKLTPPFYAESHAAERDAMLRVGHRLAPLAVPTIERTGARGDWPWLISRRVPGAPLRSRLKRLDAAARDRLVVEIGGAAVAIRSIPLAGYERAFGPWERSLAECLPKLAEIHGARGCPPAWASRIQAWVGARAALLRDGLSEPRFTHADLNGEHLLVDGDGRLSGVIDFADAMRAPPEVELLLPCLDFFRGDAGRQDALFAAAGLELAGRERSEALLALALVNRFIDFQDWFSKELRAGVGTLEDLAEAVFPSA